MSLLIQKWTIASREALLQLRDLIGGVIIPCTPSPHRLLALLLQESDQDSSKEQFRCLSLKEVCCSLRIDIQLLGEYDVENDVFIDF